MSGTEKFWPMVDWLETIAKVRKMREEAKDRWPWPGDAYLSMLYVVQEVGEALDVFTRLEDVGAKRNHQREATKERLVEEIGDAGMMVLTTMAMFPAEHDHLWEEDHTVVKQRFDMDEFPAMGERLVISILLDWLGQAVRNVTEWVYFPGGPGEDEAARMRYAVHGLMWTWYWLATWLHKVRPGTRLLTVSMKRLRRNIEKKREESDGANTGGSA